jgi:hypothetical protein
MLSTALARTGHIGVTVVSLDIFGTKLFGLAEAAMTRLIFSLVLTSAIAVTSVVAMARSHHRRAPVTHLYNRCDPNAVLAAGYAGYNLCNEPNAVFVAGTYAGADPDPNIRAALIREFGRRGR